MSSIIHSILKAAFAINAEATKKRAFFNGGFFNPAPSYWALVPVRTGVIEQRAKCDGMVSQGYK